MTSKIIRYPSDLPYPVAKAVQLGDILFLSGQVSMSKTGEPIYGSVDTQTRNTMDSIKATLEGLGASLDSVVRVTVWLSDIKYFPEFNQAYESYFPNGFPARSTVQSLPAANLDVEIEVTAVKL